uniref:Uncharacterized protein n=1 Tax=Physcomitrium patens TaxID=3218 RepID=A0A2K1IWP2_PHYPA|nr:hypothetical protein PHYPA_023510 [Physcomitrium patens]
MVLHGSVAGGSSFFTMPIILCLLVSCLLTNWRVTCNVGTFVAAVFVFDTIPTLTSIPVFISDFTMSSTVEMIKVIWQPRARFASG